MRPISVYRALVVSAALSIISALSGADPTTARADVHWLAKHDDPSNPVAKAASDPNEAAMAIDAQGFKSMDKHKTPASGPARAKKTHRPGKDDEEPAQQQNQKHTGIDGNEVLDDAKQKRVNVAHVNSRRKTWRSGPPKYNYAKAMEGWKAVGPMYYFRGRYASGGESVAPGLAAVLWGVGLGLGLWAA